MMKKRILEEPEKKGRDYYGLHPWTYELKGERCEIVAYVEASGRREIVAVILPTSGASAEALARFVTAVANDSRRHEDLLEEAGAALWAVLQEGLTFTTEQEVEVVVDRFFQRGMLSK